MKTAVFAALLLIAFAVRGAQAAERPGGRRWMWKYQESFLAISGEEGLGAPTGVLGARIGYVRRQGLGADLGVGVGVTGLQLAAMARYHRPVTRLYTLFAGFGPSLALHGGPLGTGLAYTKRQGSTRYATWVNLEVGPEARVPGGVFFRLALGVFARLAENMTDRCPGSCSAEHTSPVPRAEDVAELPWWPYLGGSVGVVF